MMQSTWQIRRQRIAEGWVQMDDALCPQCEQQLMKDGSPEKLTWCVQCDQRVMTESDLLAELESTRKMTSRWPVRLAADEVADVPSPPCGASAGTAVTSMQRAPAEKERKYSPDVMARLAAACDRKDLAGTSAPVAAVQSLPSTDETERLLDEPALSHQADSSTKMAEKLLAGWTMLGDQCPACDCVLMRDKERGIMWCVSCDQQVMSPEEYAHHMFVEGKTQAANASCETMSSTQPLSNPESSSKESADEHTNESLAVQSWSFAPAASADARKADVGSAVCSLSSELCADRTLRKAEQALQKKLAEATAQLDQCAEIRKSTELVKLMAEYASSLSTLQTLHEEK